MDHYITNALFAAASQLNNVMKTAKGIADLAAQQGSGGDSEDDESGMGAGARGVAKHTYAYMSNASCAPYDAMSCYDAICADSVSNKSI